jgi:hypothetical protein
VNDTTGQALKTIISNAQEQGLTLKELTDKIRSGMTAMFDEAKAGRARTIAMTETMQGIQTTQMIGWKESGVVESKEWIASQYPNGRHNEMNGQVVALDQPFVHPGGDLCDAGTEFDRPGGSGLAEQDINCQCDMAPVVSERARMDWLGRRLERKLYAGGGKGTRTWETRENLRRLRQ